MMNTQHQEKGKVTWQRISKRNRTGLSSTLLALILAASLLLSSCQLFKKTPESATKPGATLTTIPGIEQAGTATPLPAQPPRLLTYSPEPGEELPVDREIVLRFDQPMDRASVEQAVLFEPAIEGAYSWDDDRTMRIGVKSGTFQRDTVYRVVITSTAKSAAGLPVRGPLRFQAQTVGSLRVTDVNPGHNNENVAVDAPIRLAFNRPVVPLVGLQQQASLPNPLVLEPAVTGSGQWVNTSLYSFTPDQPLLPGTRYTAKVPAGLQDTTGGILDTDYTWSFTTQMPGITRVVPADGMRFVPPTSTIQLEFNQAMDQRKTESLFSLVDVETEARVAGSFSWQENTLVFSPAEPLGKGRAYRVSLTAGAPAATGEASIDRLFESSFTVLPKPAVISYQPGDGETLATPDANIQINFSSPMSPTMDGTGIVITPKVTLYTYWSEDKTTVYVAASLAPSTRYTITLTKELVGLFGDALAEETSFRFTTAPAAPEARLMVYDRVGLYNLYAKPAVSIEYINVNTLYLELYRVSTEEFLTLQSEDSWQTWQNYAGKAEDLERKWSLSTDASLNKTGVITTRLVRDNGTALKPGFYMLTLASDKTTFVQKHLVLISDTNLVLKASSNHALVWATDLKTGLPAADVKVRFYGPTGELLGQASTNEDGLAEAEFTTLEPWQQLAVLAERGESTTAVLSNWNGGISPWEFDINFNPMTPQYLVYLYTERAIYRPGQQVFYKGIIRLDNDAQYRLPAANTPVDVFVYDSQGRQVLWKTLVTNENGTINDSFLLAEGATTGIYHIEAVIGNETFYTFLQVAEYRKPEFTVSIRSNKAEFLHNDIIQMTGEASYYTGNPVVKGNVSWRVSQQPFYFDRWDGDVPFSFGDYDYATLFPIVETGSSLVAEGSSQTDQAGKYRFQVTADLSQQRQSQTFMLEASVTDASNQEVSERTSVIVHKGSFYIGVHPLNYVGLVNTPQSVEIITVDTLGITRTNRTLDVTVFRREWYSAQEQTPDGGSYWVNKPQDTAVATYTIQTDRLGYALVGFTPTESGSYKILVSGIDEAGNQVTSSDFMWISGGEYVNWGQMDNNRLKLIADKKSYAVGDTARIMVPSPFEGKYQALLTIERGQVLESRVLELEGTSPIIDIPVTAEFIPNAYISVFLVRGMTEDGAKAEYRVGYVNLPVSTAEKELTVQITPQGGGVYRPGDEVTFEIAVADAHGQPVEAEVSLDLVDLAVWALSGGDTRDIVQAFYGERGLGILTASPLVNAPTSRQDAVADEGKGGSGGIPDTALSRGTFKDTAYWRAVLQTDTNGRASVAVTLPDNLTTWRLTALAVTPDSLVGRGSKDIVSKLDLMVRPISPRFLVTGDRPVLGATIQNETDETLDLTVELAADGLDIAGARKLVTIKPRQQAVVNWETSVTTNAAVAAITFSAESKAYRDAVTLRLPVYHPSSPEVVGTAGDVEDTTVELIYLPENIDPALGSLTVHIDHSLTAGMQTGLEYLKTYEYECIEQTISRFLPNLAIYLARQNLGMEPTEMDAALPDEISSALQRIYAQQNLDGGWGWWYGESSNPALTAYVIQGLTLVQKAGFSNDAYVFQRGIDYLKEWLNITQAETRSLHNLQAQVLYTLAVAGQGDLGRTTRLFGYAPDMANYARAYLAMTLQVLNPSETSRPQELVDTLVGNALLSAGGVSWMEEPGDNIGLSSDTRSTAIILRMLVQLTPDHSIIPNVVRWLMNARQEGRWRTTQETAWAILALTDYMTASGELQAEYDYRVILGNTLLREASVNGSSVTDFFEQQVPISDLLADMTPLVIEKSAGPGRLYYNAYLRYYLPAAEMQALNRGLVVQRQYFRSPDAETTVTSGEINEIITVKLTLIVAHDVYYILLEDPIPAGTEVVDTSLSTTRQVQDYQKEYEYDGILDMPYQLWRDPWRWGWPWATHTEIRDNKVTLFANALTSGTYEYTYQLRCTTPGSFQVLPALAYEMYQPDRFGRSEGLEFTITP